MPNVGRPSRDCGNCRQRRQKCDLARPHCSQCLRRGQPCPGYRDEFDLLLRMENTSTVKKQGGRVRRKLVSALDQQSIITGLSELSHLPGVSSSNLQEIHNFHFFRTVTAPSLAGGCDFGIWTRYTLQASHAYPPLWHATAALGAMHRQYISDNKLLLSNSAAANNETIGGGVQFALRQFNMSIQSLRKMFASGNKAALNKNDKVVVLASCILFTCLCTLQNCQMQALMHINHGIKLIHEWELDRSIKIQHQNDDDVDVALDMLQVILTQLDTQGTHIRGGVGMMHTAEQQTTTADSSQSVHTLQPFYTFLQAYVEMEKLINRLIRVDQTIYGASPITPQKEAYFDDFTVWDTRFQGYLATTKSSKVVVDENLLRVLNMRRLYAQTLLNDSTKGELGHDEFINQYATIITLAEQILEARYAAAVLSKTRQPDFSLSVPVSESILMTIMRCREPSIRHRALQLLAMYPHREGIMNGTMAREILGNFAAFEEKACKDSMNECSSVGSWICARHRVSFQSFMQISRLGVQGMARWRE